MEEKAGAERRIIAVAHCAIALYAGANLEDNAPPLTDTSGFSSLDFSACIWTHNYSIIKKELQQSVI